MSAKIQIRWRDNNCPMDTPVTGRQVVQSQAMTRARKHLAIDCGTATARKCAANLARNLTRLADCLPDGTLHVHTTNQSTAPSPWSSNGAQIGLAVEVRYVPDDASQQGWDIHLYGRQYYGRCGQYTYAVVPPIDGLYVMRERIEMAEMPLRTATYMTQIVRRVGPKKEMLSAE